MSGGPFHVLTRDGDAVAEVEAALRALADDQGVRREDAGLHRALYVERARQTVVMAADADAPIARVLRARPGWREPGATGGGRPS